MSLEHELSVPDAARKDPASVELARVWAASKAQHVSLRVGIWKDPAGWGIMLADLARHVAAAYRQEEGFDEAKTLARIRAAFEAEMGSG
jgi:hypothetical protein